MLTTSHAAWAATLSKHRSHSRWFVAGAVVPDAPALLVATGLLISGTPRPQIVFRTYHRSPWRELHLVAHALWPATLLGLPGRRSRALVGGWLTHLAVDYATHHDDAWPPLWPLTTWRWASPVSYWQNDHHACALTVCDLVGLAASRRAASSRLTPVAMAVAGLALAQQLGAITHPWASGPPWKGRAHELSRR